MERLYVAVAAAAAMRPDADGESRSGEQAGPKRSIPHVRIQQRERRWRQPPPAGPCDNAPMSTGAPTPPKPEPDRTLGQVDRGRRTLAVKTIVAVVLAVLLIIFIIGNSRRVPIDFVFFTRNARLIWIMLACAVIGGVVGYLIGKPGRQFYPKRGKHKPKG